MQIVSGYKAGIAVAWLPLLAVLFLAGCGALDQRSRLEQFEVVTEAYRKAVSWSDFERAAEIGGVTGVDGKVLDRLRGVKVASYEQKQVELSPDGMQARCNVNIEYTAGSSIRVRSLVDRQVWRFDAAAGRWLLVSGLPDFSERK